METQEVTVGPFQFRFESVRLPMGLVVARVNVTGEGAKVSGPPFDLSLPNAGQLEAELTEQDLAAFLEEMAPGGLKGFRVEAADGKLNVNAKINILVDLKVEAIVTLRIENERRLWVDLVSVNVSGAGIKHLVKSQLEKINPILDTNDFPVNAVLDEIVISGGRVMVYGRVAPK